MFKIEFYTPKGYYKTVDATMVNVFTNDGQRGFLSNHMQEIAPLTVSRLEIVNDNKKDYYAISNGVLHFKDNVCKIIVEAIEHKDEIDVKRAMAAKMRALGYLKSNDPNINLKRAKLALNKAINRIEISNLK